MPLSHWGGNDCMKVTKEFYNNLKAVEAVRNDHEYGVHSFIGLPLCNERHKRALLVLLLSLPLPFF